MDIKPKLVEGLLNLAIKNYRNIVLNLGYNGNATG